MSPRLVALVLVMTAAAGHAGAQSLTVAVERSEEKAARTVVLAQPIALGLNMTAVATPDRAEIVRVHTVVAGAPGAGATWTLVCQPAATDAARTLAGGSAWSAELTADGARVTEVTCKLNGPTGATPPAVSVDRVAVSVPPNATPQGITPPGDQSEPIYKKVGKIRDWARSVARLTFEAPDGFHYYCTAFLISPELMLTNAHCIHTDASMRSAIADFDFDQLKPSQTVGFKELVAWDGGLDYSLLRLEQAQPATRPRLTLKESVLTERKALAVIEHPNGKPKRVSLVDCHVEGVSMAGISGTTDFGHYCDTEHGSSGSPILEMPSGNVIGLHHLGYENGETPLNRGVKIGLILKSLQDKGVTLP